MTSIKRSLTVKGNHRETGWAKEDQILESITTVVEEHDIEAIQLSQRNILITFTNKEAKIAAVTFGLHINKTFVSLTDVERDAINVTLRDIPIEIPNSVIHAHISKYAENVEDVSHGYIRKSDGTISTVKTGVRYITVTGLKTPIPNNPTIAGHTGRLSYRGQPCSTCSSTDHPYYRCPNKEGTGCFRCGSKEHRIKDCMNAWGTSSNLPQKSIPPKTQSNVTHIKFDDMTTDSQKSASTNEEMKSDQAAINDKEKENDITSEDTNYDTIIVGASMVNAMSGELKDAGIDVRAKSGKRVEEMKELLYSQPIDREIIKNIGIHAGVNNICYYNDSPEDTAVKYDNLVKDINQDMPNAKIYVCSISPIHPYKQEGLNSKVRKMNKLLKCMCDRLEYTTFIDTFDLLLCKSGLTAQSDYTMSDPKGIHLSNKGYRKLAYYLRSKMETTNITKTPVSKRKDRGSSGNTPNSSEKNPKSGKFTVRE
ncbi:unnamed protein product [Owenia fusiformis]|uniref:Uncharacterized protein n=1 Tax=Owenia fusiformis TaxID=6347 RepID=A0A8J1U5U8_OWEFU|nr:unnamed protein product [Owenia fusiformis]